MAIRSAGCENMIAVMRKCCGEDDAALFAAATAAPFFQTVSGCTIIGKPVLPITPAYRKRIQDRILRIRVCSILCDGEGLCMTNQKKKCYT